MRTKPAANRKVIGSTHDLTDQVLTLRINDDSSEGDDDDGVTNAIRAESEGHANVITIGDDMHGTLPQNSFAPRLSFGQLRLMLNNCVFSGVYLRR